MVQNPTRYSRVAIILHWAIAAAIVFQIVLGLRMGGESSASTYAVFQLHKSIGITILVLSLLRLGWRLTHRAPPHADDMPTFERIASHLTHIGFYVIMIGLPVTGWILVSAAKINIPTLLYSTIPWPHIGLVAGLDPEMKEVWEKWAANGHTALSWLTYVLLALHIGAVIKHQWFDKQPLLARMTGKGSSGLKEPRLWIALGAMAAVGLSATLYTQPKPAPQKTEVTVAIEPTDEYTTEQAIAVEVAETEVVEETAAAEEEKMPLSQWTVDRSSAELGFSTSWSGEAVRGSFNDWSADIRFSPDDLANSRIKVTINTRSASTGDAQRDSTLPGTEFFDTSAHPQAEFTASRIRKAGADRYVASGTLSLKGVSAPITLPFRLTIDGDTATARGTASLDRTTFGVGQGMYADISSIPAMVNVEFRFKATRQP